MLFIWVILIKYEMFSYSYRNCSCFCLPCRSCYSLAPLKVSSACAKTVSFSNLSCGCVSQHIPQNSSEKQELSIFQDFIYLNFQRILFGIFLTSDAFRFWTFRVCVQQREWVEWLLHWCCSWPCWSSKSDNSFYHGWKTILFHLSKSCLEI